MNKKQALSSTGKIVNNSHIGKRATVKSYNSLHHFLIVRDGSNHSFAWDADNCKVVEEDDVLPVRGN